MLTIDQIVEYLEHNIADQYLAGEKMELRHLQTAAGVLKAAAEAAGDKDTAFRFRLVAANAANKQEELSGD